MSGRLRWLALGVAVVGVSGALVTIVIAAVSTRVESTDAGWPWMTITVACIAAGAMITLSRPDHPVGWLFLGFGALTPTAAAVLGARLAVAERDPSWWYTVPEAVATAGLAAQIPLILMLFPTGRLLSRRWRVGVALALTTATLGTAAALLNGGWAGDYPSEAVAASPLYGRLDPLGDILVGLFYPLLMASFLVGATSLIVRYRRSRGEERLQLRWLAAAAAGLLVVVPFLIGEVGGDLVTVVFIGALCLVPIGAGIAVARYRLYDIDLVINRALVYGALSGALALVYIAAVLLLQFLLSPLTERSDLAVAGSTLAVAALFGPARRRIQIVVDRRFYRRRYDAGRALEAFSGHLREQVDIEKLGTDLYDVVRRTVAPTHASLWLRSEA